MKVEKSTFLADFRPLDGVSRYNKISDFRVEVVVILLRSSALFRPNLAARSLFRGVPEV
jgi:hypothetical protein